MIRCRSSRGVPGGTSEICRGEHLRRNALPVRVEVRYLAAVLSQPGGEAEGSPRLAIPVEIGADPAGGGAGASARIMPGIATDPPRAVRPEIDFPPSCARRAEGIVETIVTRSPRLGRQRSRSPRKSIGSTARRTSTSCPRQGHARRRSYRVADGPAAADPRGARLDGRTRTPSSGTAGTSGAATGRRRAVAGQPCSRQYAWPGTRGNDGSDELGGHCRLPAGEEPGRPGGLLAAGLRVRVMPGLREISPVWVSEGGLEHPKPVKSPRIAWPSCPNLRRVADAVADDACVFEDRDPALGPQRPIKAGDYHVDFRSAVQTLDRDD